MSDPTIAVKVREDDENVRLRADKKRDLVHSKDEIKAIMIEQLKMTGMMERKLAHAHAKSREEAAMMNMIERTRIMDLIYLKHKIRTVDLMNASKEHDLDNDPDIMMLKNSNAA